MHLPKLVSIVGAEMEGELVTTSVLLHLALERSRGALGVPLLRQLIRLIVPGAICALFVALTGTRSRFQ